MKDSDPVYLDYAATTPVDPLVMDKMLPWFTQNFGNAASRFHAYGWQADEAADEARNTIARHTGFTEKEVVFTSGATESVNLALTGFFENNSFKGKLITVATEHKATLDTAAYLQTKGVDVVYLGVNRNGEINLQELDTLPESSPCLLSLLQINNETGVVHPVNDIIKLAHKKGIVVHIDATQAVGKLPVPALADLVSFSGHKIYGPKGIGCLLAKKETKLTPQIHGGNHQRNRRSGTLNIPGIVGLASAFELSDLKRETENTRIAILTNQLEQQITEALPFAGVNAAEANRAAGFSSICFRGIDGEELLFRLNKIAVSNGSACNSASTEPSYVLRAMGLSEADAYASVRFSLGRFTKTEDIERAVQHVIETAKNLTEE
jgi:cysteine desulfurase